MRLVAVIEDEAVAGKILRHLGLEARPPPRRKSSSRAGQQLLLDEAARSTDGIDPPAAVE